MVEILLWKMNESKTYRKWFRYRGQIARAMIHIRSNGVKYRCSAYDSVWDFVRCAIINSYLTHLFTLETLPDMSI